MHTRTPDLEHVEQHTEWCRGLFALMAEGGVWGVPRSGLLFRKERGKLLLVDQMPHEAEMPLSADELLEYQSIDFECIRRHFGAAGIEVLTNARDRVT